MKVYVVQSGIYSDRHIVGIASDMETAKTIKEISDRVSREKADITEYETDYYTPLKDSRLFDVNEYRGKYDVHETDYFNVLGLSKSTKVNSVANGFKGSLNVYVLAKDEAHALKIAQDLFAEYKAKKEGVAI